MSTKEIDEFEEKLLSKYDSVYDAIVEIAAKNINVIDDLKISEKIKKVIQDVCKKIKLPTVEVRGMLELTSNKSNGVEIIRNALLDSMKEKNNDKIEISYIGAPKYRVSIVAQDFKTAEKTLKPLVENIEKKILKSGGTFKFSREESKKTGGQ